MTAFKKLVRDRIPEIITAEGRHPVVDVLSGPEYRVALLAKLEEETQEVVAAGPDSYLDELADVFEVVRSIAEDAGASLADVVARAEAKAAERGRFERRFFLIRVDDV